MVDDSATIRQQLLNHLADYECVVAEDVPAALARLKEGGVGMVVSDLHMPGMSGVDLVRAMKADPAFAALPILVMTTESGMGDVQECRALGCSGYLLKPVDANLLLAKVRKFLPATNG